MSRIDSYYLFKLTDQFLKQILPPSFLCIQSSKIDRVSSRKVLELLSANQIKQAQSTHTPAHFIALLGVCFFGIHPDPHAQPYKLYFKEQYII